jgi:hypothetical protein
MKETGRNAGDRDWWQSEEVWRELRRREDLHHRERLRQRINQVWDIVARERSAMSNART